MNRKELRYLRKTYHKAIRDKKIVSMEDLFAFRSGEIEIPPESWAMVLEVSEEEFKRLRYFPHEMEVRMVNLLCGFLDLDYRVISGLYYKSLEKHGIPYFEDIRNSLEK